MYHQMQTIIIAILLAAVSGAAPLYADNEGQEDLNKATEKKMSASTLDDLNEIIRLGESALQKGLDDANKEFANKILASSYLQRGGALAAATATVYQMNQKDARWPQLRKQAVEDLEKSVKLDPKQPQGLMMLVQMNVMPDGDMKRAKEAATQAVDAITDDPNMKAKALVLRATLEEDLEKRLPDMNEAVRMAPDDANILRARGAVFADLGKNDEALADLDKSLAADPDNLGTLEVKAMIYSRMKKFDEALACIDKLAEKMPDSPIPLMQKSNIHTLAGKPDAAIEDLTKAYEKDIGNIGILIARAQIYHDKGDKEKALADADECLRLRPNNPPATRYRALLLADMDRMDEAVSSIEKLIEREPKDMLNILSLAQIYVTKKQSAKALEVYDKYLAKEPENALLLQGRGDAYLNLGKQAEAIADYEKAYKLDPKDSGLLNNFAWVLATATDDKLRDGKRALEMAKQACELTEYQKPHILSTLAAAYAETGDFENAKKWAAKAVEIGIKDQDDELKKELKSYEEKKPWREKLNEDAKDKDAKDKDATDKEAEKKPAA